MATKAKEKVRDVMTANPVLCRPGYDDRATPRSR